MTLVMQREKNTPRLHLISIFSKITHSDVGWREEMGSLSLSATLGHRSDPSMHLVLKDPTPTPTALLFPLSPPPSPAPRPPPTEIHQSRGPRQAAVPSRMTTTKSLKWAWGHVFLPG